MRPTQGKCRKCASHTQRERGGRERETTNACVVGERLREGGGGEGGRLANVAYRGDLHSTIPIGSVYDVT